MSEVSWQELTKSECFGLLAGHLLGRAVRVDDRGPTALPVNFVLDRHTVVFRSGEGTKRTGWSILARGEATKITDPDDRRAYANCR